MKESEWIGKIYSSMEQQCKKRGYAAPVDVLMDIGVLPKQKYEDWRNGRVDYLERVCTVNLHKLSFIMSQIRAYAREQGLKPSFCYYKQWGVKKKNGQGHKPADGRRRCRSHWNDFSTAADRIIRLILARGSNAAPAISEAFQIIFSSTS